MFVIKFIFIKISLKKMQDIFFPEYNYCNIFISRILLTIKKWKK